MQGEEARVRCGTSKGPIVMQLHRDWSPNGYDRATELFEKVSRHTEIVVVVCAKWTCFCQYFAH
jgi:hypothetical protein